MKKILIGVIILLLIVFIGFVLIKGINIGSLRLESISNIKDKSKNLEDTLTNANELTKKEYPSQIENLNSVIKKLELAKEQYENKTANMADPSQIGITQVKTYKVEYLWTIIGNYATKQGTTLTLDIKNTQSKDIYDLSFNLVGSYVGITDFIYDIEKDENLKFEIENFELVSATVNKQQNTTNNNTTQNTTNSTINKNTTNTNSTTTATQSDGRTLKATFTVKNVGIELN